MATINVNSDVSDQFYRYKMPKIIAKVEGKGNGIKTVIVNMVDIAKALSRPPTYPTKYFGCELGAQTQFDIKNERYIVNGSHDCSKLQSLLDGFIKRFVLCSECGNPETVLTVSQKNQTIKARCRACGYTSLIDMRHKLTTFILKNPPDMDPLATTPSKGSKKDKKEKKQKKNAVNGDSQENNDRASPEVNSQEQNAAQRASGGVIDAPPENESNEDEDDDWGEDVSQEAVAKRMQELTDAAKTLAMSEDLEKTANERIDLFYSFVKNKMNNGTLSSTDQEIMAEAERLEVKDKAVLILVELLMNEKILAQIKQYRKLLLRFCRGNQKAQKYLLGGLEQLIGNVHKDALLPKVPHILKELYDEDIIEEEVLLEWGQKVSKKYVSKAVSQEIHDKAAPFIKWLEEAEEEESDSDDDVEVDFSATGKVDAPKVVTTPKQPAAPEPSKDDEDDDDDDDDENADEEIDIDAI